MLQNTVMCFYIGGTKIGALCGEAIVFTKQNEPKNFTTIINIMVLY